MFKFFSHFALGRFFYMHIYAPRCTIPIRVQCSSYEKDMVDLDDERRLREPSELETLILSTSARESKVVSHSPYRVNIEHSSYEVLHYIVQCGLYDT